GRFDQLLAPQIFILLYELFSCHVSSSRFLVLEILTDRSVYTFNFSRLSMIFFIVGKKTGFNFHPKAERILARRRHFGDILWLVEWFVSYMIAQDEARLKMSRRSELNRE